MSRLKPFGIGDLIVLKQRLLNYSAGEIAHIENIMAFEERNRYHRRLNRLELTLQSETEIEKESKKDLETTERFELEQQIKNEVKDQHKFAVGAEVSGGFGPVQISAYARYDLTHSEENSQQTSQKYAREITQKASERLKESIKELRKSFEINETEERNEHKFKNTSEENHSGIYRWVDKTYLVKPVNYGKRLFYEVVIPEPARSYVFNRTWNIQNNEMPEKPTLPSLLQVISLSPYRARSVPLAPNNLDRSNYSQWVADYGAEAVKPPPSQSLMVSKALSKELNGTGDFVLDDLSVKIPDGYKARRAIVALLVKSWRSHTVNAELTAITPTTYTGTYFPFVKIQVGQKAVLHWKGLQWEDFTGENAFALELAGESDMLAISGAGNSVGALALNFEVECECSDELFQKWQLATYQSIMTAYQKKLSAYEDKVANLRISGGVQISGDNPLRNLTVIKDELKKSFLEIWMRSDGVTSPGWNDGSSESAPAVFPSLLVDNIIRDQDKMYFADQAFDWENVSFKFVPYFAGRKSRWLELSNYTDPDPVFENFLKAGAAIVRFPVVPQMTHVVLYYQLTGMIWSRLAGEVPALSSVAGPEAELYNGFLNEVNPEEDDTNIFNAVEIQEDDPDVFTVTVPTELVWLQEGTNLNPILNPIEEV